MTGFALTVKLKTRRILSRLVFILILMVLSVLLSTINLKFNIFPVVYAQTKPAQNTPISTKDEAAKKDEGTKEKKQKEFNYRWAGRPDPFKPFIEAEEITRQEMEIPEEELTGMRKFEPGQLTLVAIIFSGNKPLAMVQDSTGMGYILHKGDEVGRTGIVTDITPKKVLIRELSHKTHKNEKRYRTVEMVLRKEGEQ